MVIDTLKSGRINNIIQPCLKNWINFSVVKSRIFDQKTIPIYRGKGDIKMYMDYYWYSYPERSIKRLADHLVKINRTSITESDVSEV